MFKKTLIAAAVLSFGSVAFAASQVTLYGVIDEGVVLQKAKGKDATVDLRSGFTAGPRFGFKGVEELGNGYSVGFILEQGFGIDTGDLGATGKAFNRESALYVQGGFGRLTFGRLGTLAFAQSTGMLKGATFGTTWGASGWNGNNYGVNFSRVDNAVAYVSPSLSGLTIHAMYSNKMSGDDSTDKWSKNNHYYGLGLKYTKGALDSSLIFEVADYKDPTAKVRNAMYHITLGGTYNFNVVKPYAIYQFATQDDNYRQHYAGLGIEAPLGGGKAKFGGKYIFRKATGANKTLVTDSTEKKANVWSLGAGYEYPFSKRTNLWSYAGYADGAKAWKETESVFFNGYQVAIGLKHTF